MRVSTKGQITLPAKFRKLHHIHPGDQVSFDVKTGQVSKLPTRREWLKVLKRIPTEDVHMDKAGHYDPKQAPHFHDWMRFG